MVHHKFPKENVQEKRFIECPRYNDATDIHLIFSHPSSHKKTIGFFYLRPNSVILLLFFLLLCLPMAASSSLADYDYQPPFVKHTVDYCRRSEIDCIPLCHYRGCAQRLLLFETANVIVDRVFREAHWQTFMCPAHRDQISSELVLPWCHNCAANDVADILTTRSHRGDEVRLCTKCTTEPHVGKQLWQFTQLRGRYYRKAAEVAAAFIKEQGDDETEMDPLFVHKGPRSKRWTASSLRKSLASNDNSATAANTHSLPLLQQPVGGDDKAPPVHMQLYPVDNDDDTPSPTPPRVLTAEAFADLEQRVANLESVLADVLTKQRHRSKRRLSASEDVDKS